MISWLKVLSISVVSVFLPVKAVIITALVLCILDLILGLWASVKRGDKITSKGISRTVSKIVVYEAAILSGYLIQHFMMEDSIPIVNIISGIIGLTEGKSVLENLNTISNSDLFKSLIDRLSSQSDKQPPDGSK